MEEMSPRLSALAHPHRMALVRLLVRRYPDRVPAGEIAAALGLKASTASVYLATLTRAGLLTQKRVGASLRYSVDIGALRGVMTDLLAGWRGRPDLAPPPPPTNRSRPMSQAPTEPTLDATNRYDVLFICTGNSARSIFAEAILRKVAGDRFHAHSAGTKPHSELNPIALEMLRNKGYDVSVLRSKNVSEFQGPDATVMDFVFTVCDRAANEECPAWPGQPITAHWGQPDPVKATGSMAQRMLAFQEVYGALRNRIEVFASFPIASLDARSLQRRVDEIGRMERAGESA
jgi:arsenate reductase